MAIMAGMGFRNATVVLVLMSSAGCASQRPFPWGSSTPLAVEHQAVETVGTYQRAKSRVLVRRIKEATLAVLDHAAYHENVMIHDPEVKLLPDGPPEKSEVFFQGLVESIVTSLAETPLTEAERKRPMAFPPMVDFLSRWSYEKASGLEDLKAAVRTESWGYPKNVQVTYQSITDAFLHKGNELWVKIEFAQWAHLFADMPKDENGFCSIYGRVKQDLVNKEVIEHLERTYLKEVLDAKAITKWANELASFWYPSHNTDIYDLGNNAVWPIADTEQQIKEELAGRNVEQPTVIIRGKPFGKPIYNVFVVDGVTVAKKSTSAGAAEIGDRTVTPLLDPLKKSLAAEAEAHGGYAKWAAAVKPLHKQLRKKLKKRPEDLKALIGKDAFLFYRNSLNYVVGGDLQQQKPGKNPFDTIVAFKDSLAQLGVDFLLVPVPTKAEVFPEKILKTRPNTVLNPYGRKLLAELMEAGVEVVDLLPVYLEAREKMAMPKGGEQLYQPQDTHWSHVGMDLTAELIVQRIRKYPWAKDLPKVEFKTKQVSFKRAGDLVSRLADAEQRKHKPQTLAATQVILPDGTPYEDDPEAAIVVLGDSFTGVYQRTDCRHAGISAQLALKLGALVDLVMSYGGGPNVRKKLLRRGTDSLKKKRLLIWMFAARDLYDYWEDWEPVEIKP